MITAGNITDEQIRELYHEAWQQLCESLKALGVSPPALGPIEFDRNIDKQAARARCAEILNARKAVQP